MDLLNEDPETSQDVTLSDIAERMDWQQAVLNGGPPCFHVEDGRFCGRAERWHGHGIATHHAYVSLQDLLIWV